VEHISSLCHPIAKKNSRMATMTAQTPTGQVGWFEQMLRTMGWVFRKEETAVSVAKENTSVF